MSFEIFDKSLPRRRQEKKEMNSKAKGIGQQLKGIDCLQGIESPEANMIAPCILGITYDDSYFRV